METHVGDAYVVGGDDGTRWSIGTDALEVVFEARIDGLALAGLRNKLSGTATDYVDAPGSSTPHGLNGASLAPFAVNDTTRWTVEGGSGREVLAGGRPAVQLDLHLVGGPFRATLHVLTFPRTAVLRYWSEVENTGEQVALESITPVAIAALGDEATSFVNHSMIGGNSQADQGKLQTESITDATHRTLESTASLHFVPWTALQRSDDPHDGWFLAMECLGDWSLAIDHERPGPITLRAIISQMDNRTLSAGDSIDMPVVTLGVFQGDLDDMGRRLHEWQYEYMWDYTHPDWHGGMQFLTAWFQGARNLQEQYAGRLGYLDMDAYEYMREGGLDVMWDDAAWSANRNIWDPNYEGPDFSQTLRFLAKCDMRWTLWMCGLPSNGVTDTKVGSWGDYQWRTDGVPLRYGFDGPLRRTVTQFKRSHPNSSWHTCNGGSTYSHTFDIHRYGDVHYDSDYPGGEFTNHYFSLLDTPDKVFDMILNLSAHEPYKSRRMLCCVPKWSHYLPQIDETIGEIRWTSSLYRYLRDQGVTGRWSVVAHPEITGDEAHHYFQRLSHDRTKSLIVLKHRTEGVVTIYPQGLLGTHGYLVEFESHRAPLTRTGSELMADGIRIEDPPPGELIYLNLPNRPGSAADKEPPQPPGRVLTRRETNLGYCGVGVYWSPGSDDNWVSHYEVRRGDEPLGNAATGTYYFDRSTGRDPAESYAVRTIDGDGNASDWTEATPLEDEPLQFAVLGAHSSQVGKDGWSAETTTDGSTYSPMAWVAPVRYSATDLGGTADQDGGAEGYWEGAGTARIGRGWQHASTEAMCVRRWTAPRDGTVRIVGRAFKEYHHRDDGAALRVRILHDETRVWPAEEWADAQPSDFVGSTHDLTVDVAEGDELRFVMDAGTTPNQDYLAWMPRIVYLDAVSPPHEDATTVRIACGADEPYRDGCGHVWSEDRFYQGGRPTTTDRAILDPSPTPEDGPLYQTGRAGESFEYAVAVAPGLYSVRLKFAEPDDRHFFERPFSLEINGRQVLRNVDVCHMAQGPGQAFEKIFRYLIPNADGELRLRFSAGWEPVQTTREAIAQAIEVMPELKPTIRINVGADAPWVDWNSFEWAADSSFSGGTTIATDTPVAHASPTLYDQSLYQTARSGQAFQYKIAAPPGLYAVHLKFAELWLQEPGGRPMDVSVNGRLIRENWDPATTAGELAMSADIRTKGIAPAADGNITIAVSSTGAHDAILQGIEIE